MKPQIKKVILSTIVISVTTYLWTNTNNLQSFLSFTAHWLNNNFQLRHTVLQMQYFSSSHTADNIKQHLEETPTLWDINPTKIHAMVYDNGRNIGKAIDDSSFQAVSCFIHTLQLVINNTLKVETIAQVIRNSGGIVTNFNHSGPAEEKLHNIQK